MRKQAAVKINPELLKPIDRVVKSVKDEFGAKRFKSRREFIDEAVRDFLHNLKSGSPQTDETGIEVIQKEAEQQNAS